MIHGYTRVSTEDQAREGRSSLEEQERRIRTIAALTEGVDLWIWSDPGVSGSIPLGQRPVGVELVQALQSGDTIIAAKLDRLFRNAEDALSQSRAWRERGIDLILIDMGPEPVTTSATGRLYFGMLAQFAEFERERIAERIRDGRSAKRARGGFAGGNAPIGQRVEGIGRAAVVVPNDREITMVRMAQEMVVNDPSPTSIAKRLTALGFRSRNDTPIVAAQVWRWIRQGTN